MNRDEFMEKLTHQGTTMLKNGGQSYLVNEEYIVIIPYKYGHVYSTEEEFFNAKLGDKTLGELVDELKIFDEETFYHLPEMFFDENGDMERYESTDLK